MKPIRTFLPNCLPWWLTMVLLAVILEGVAMAAPADDEKAQTIVHMLDYVGVDYPGVVQDGKVVNAEEYAEQHEFATQALVLVERVAAGTSRPPAGRKTLRATLRRMSRCAGSRGWTAGQGYGAAA